MNASRRDWRKIAFKAVFYLVTIVITCLLVWAMRRACLYFNAVRRIWAILFVAGLVYYGYALFRTYSKKGILRFKSHLLLLQLLPICAFIFVHCVVKKYGDGTISGSASKNEYERYFNDLQAEQKVAAINNGLEPFASRKQFEEQCRSLLKRDKLVRISTNSDYVVQPLRYSVPYVVPKVERLLDDLADSFQKKMQARVKFVVTSVLRTEEDVKNLRKVNANATSQSCHCYATTIDISYANFDSNGGGYKYQEVRLALAKALSELRDQGRCYVKFEARQRCYHITVR